MAKELSDLVVEKAQLDVDAPELFAPERRLAQRLETLLSDKPQVELLKKTTRLEKGFLDNAVGFTSFVDLRPCFDADHAEISGWIPMIQLRITTDSSLKSNKSIVLQLNRETLEALKDTLDDVESKLTKVTRTLSQNGLVQLGTSSKDAVK